MQLEKIVYGDTGAAKDKEAKYVDLGTKLQKFSNPKLSTFNNGKFGSA